MSTATSEPLPADEQAATMEAVREYLRILWTYKWVILAVLTVVSAGVIFWTLRQPKVYQATCTIEYDPNPIRPLGQDVEDVANPVGSFWMSREFFATQNRIISSRVVAERVVQQLGLHEDPSFFYVPEEDRQNWTAASVEGAARALQGRLTVEAVDDTRLVAIRVQDRNPERAATLANTIAETYIEKTMEDRMGSTVRALDWLGGQLDTLRDQLDTSELALHEFKEEHNVLSVSMEDRQNIVAADIERFNEALTKARTRRIELSSHLVRLRELAGEEQPEDSAASFNDHETINSLRAALREKVSAREGLSSRYGANHQRMQQLDGEIADLRGHLRRELDGLLRAAEADVNEIRRVEAGMRSALNDAHNAGLELNLREIEYSRLNRERENNQKLYSLVLQRTTETDLTRMLRTTHARMLDRALEPTAAVSPVFMTNAAGGVAAGLVLGLLMALVLARLDRRIQSAADIEALGLTILGVLPKIGDHDSPAPRPAKNKGRAPIAQGDGRDLFVHTHPMSSAAECCRSIRTNLTFMSAAKPIHAMAVTSANPRDGKTTVATNVAISIAQSGKRVLVIDTDLRRPRIHRAFGVSGARGVTSIVVGESKLEDVVVDSGIPNIDVLPCGPIPPNPSELLHSARFQALIEEAQRTYDRVIFDSPPLGAVTDAAVLAPQIDAVLLVVKAQNTTRDALGSTLRQLRDVGATVVGAVLNDVDPKRAGYGAGDYYYYRNEGYYYSSAGDDEDDDPGQGPDVDDSDDRKKRRKQSRRRASA